MFKKIENPTACEMRSVIRFLNAKKWHRLKFIVNFVTCMENMPWVVQWYGDGCDCLMKDAKMRMMIRGAAVRLWWMKIWCLQLKRRLGRTDDSELRHFPWIFLRFHGHFFTKLYLRSKKPLPLALYRRRYRSTMKGYKNWCNAVTIASTIVETMSKSSALYILKNQLFALKYTLKHSLIKIN